MWRISRPDALSVFDDEQVKKSLSRYIGIIRDEKIAKFQISKKIQSKFTKTDSLKKLWKEHSRCTKEFSYIQNSLSSKDFQEISTPTQSYLDLKIEIASRILQKCHLCSHRCGTNRLKGEKGYCLCDNKMAVSSIFAHLGEEPELVPSGTIFTLGCTMRCLHCQNWTISQWKESGIEYTPEEVAREVEQLRLNGCRNANLVGGDPTPWLQHWLMAFKHVGINIPIVWNSNSYYSQETACLLAGFADVYLLDFKYGPENCALRISDAPGYWEACVHNHVEAKKHGELIIRILVLPCHLECCVKPILKWIAGNLGTETRINIMFQYRPEWRAREVSELCRSLTTKERKKAIEIAQEIGLTNFLV